MEEENTTLFKKGENDFDFVQDDDDDDPILREATNKLENITISKKIDARFKLGCRMLLVGAVRELIIFFIKIFFCSLTFRKIFLYFIFSDQQWKNFFYHIITISHNRVLFKKN